MTGITSSLATYSGQNASWQLIDLSSAITAYAGATARVVFRYQSGSSFTGDLQLDAITVGPNTYGFETGVDGFETSTSTSGATAVYNSVTSFQALATGTSAGRWNRDTGNTPSSGTGNLGAYSGSYFVYAETSTNGTGFPSRYFWLRGPEVVLEASSPSLGFALGREGATIGTLDVYLDITVDPSIPVDVNAEGLSATSALGLVTVVVGTGTDIPSSGLQGTSVFGDVVVVEGAGAQASVTGVVSTTTIGDVGVIEGAGNTVVLTGTDALGEIGSVQVNPVVLTGVEATTLLGTVAVSTEQILNVVGVQASGLIGSVTASINISIPVTSVFATAQIGNVFVWGQIIPSQNASWVNVDDSQTAEWVDIDTEQTPNWTVI